MNPNFSSLTTRTNGKHDKITMRVILFSTCALCGIVNNEKIIFEMSFDCVRITFGTPTPLSYLLSCLLTPTIAHIALTNHTILTFACPFSTSALVMSLQP